MVAIALSGLIAGMTTRIAVMGVIARDDGILVRNWVRSRFFPWNVISGFRFGNELENLDLREMLGTPVLATYVVLKNGRHVPMVGISVTRANRQKSRTLVQEILDALEAARRHFVDLDSGPDMPTAT